jgi:hypothetical protein
MIDTQKEKLTDSAAFLCGRQSIVVLPVANQSGAAVVPITGCRTRDLPSPSKAGSGAPSLSNGDNSSAQVSSR